MFKNIINGFTQGFAERFTRSKGENTANAILNYPVIQKVTDGDLEGLEINMKFIKGGIQINIMEIED